MSEMIQSRAIVGKPMGTCMRVGYAIYQAVPLRITFSDLESLIEIFNEMKHCAASLRQLSFLFLTRPTKLGRLCNQSCSFVCLYVWR